jgi:alcohol dehydrogenase (cytochrome c)
VQTNDKCGIFTRSDAPFQRGRSYMGGSFSADPSDTGQRVLRAFDIQTGTATWELPETGAAESFGGVLSTAGGVVMYVADDNTFAAADAKTGKPLWSFQTSEQPRASPMTYLFDNKQYFAVAIGPNILAFGLPD